MMFKICFALLALLVMGFTGMQSQAQDPYGVQFGYVLGYQNSFRNRLPAPPYFSVHPPVYYGMRYERPYGDSPFAAFPQLRSTPDYHPVPKEVPFRTHSVVNPHAQHGTPTLPTTHREIGEPVASSTNITGKAVQVFNPFAVDYSKVAGD
jgi:hypothetical protein